MEQYKDEIEYCNRMGYHPNHAEEKMQLVKMFAEFKAYLIEQAKKGKMTMLECLDQESRNQAYISWSDACTGCRDYVDLNYIPQTAGKRYANQFIPVVPAEQLISVNDKLPEKTNEKLSYSDYVLAYSDSFRYGNWSISRYDHQYEMWQYDRGHDATYNKISHWMTLPAAPQSTASTKQP